MHLEHWDKWLSFIKTKISIQSFKTWFIPIESISYNQPTDFTNSEYVADQYADNETFETEADDLLDFTERNPFGTF